MKKLLWAIAVLLVVVLAAVGLFQALRGVKAEIRAVDAQARQAIAVKDAEVKALLAENRDLRARDAAGEIEKDELRKERDRAQAKLAQALEDLKTAPPETLLEKTQRLLDTREIWLRANAASQVEAVFSLSAFRKDAEALTEWHDLKFSLVPSLQQEIKVQAGQLEVVRHERDNLVTVVADKDAVIVEQNGRIDVRDDAIASLKKANLWKELRDFGLGFIFKTVLDLIIGK